MKCNRSGDCGPEPSSQVSRTNVFVMGVLDKHLLDRHQVVHNQVADVVE